MEDKKEKKSLPVEDDIDFEMEHEAPDDVSLEDEEAGAGTKMKQLRAKLAACDEEKRSIHEELQRTRADFLNSKRRLEEQLQRDRERITERHMEDLLPLADSFDMAMQDPAWQSADEIWRKGVEGIYAQLKNILRSNGIESIEPQAGSPFDPREHEALMDTGNGDVIGQVFQKGYKRGDTIIRPAKVGVGT